MIFAIDLGGTQLRLALGDGVGTWRQTHRRPRPEGLDAAGLISIIRETLATWSIGPVSLHGVGVSVAAVVDANGVILRAENIGWENVPLTRLLAQAFGCPAAVDTDVFCGGLYEARFGAAANIRSAIYVSIGTAVGHALILNRTVWRGATRGANALGHLVVKAEDGIPCYCGNNGCLCTVASGRAQSLDPPPRGALKALAQALGSAITVVEPELVILTGGALGQTWFDLAELERLLRAFAYPGLTRPSIVMSNVADSNLRGAALLLKEPS